MKLEIIAYILATAGIVIGGAAKGVVFMKGRKRQSLESLGEVKDKLYVLSKTSEEARMVLQKSNDKKLHGQNEIIKEIEYLNKELEDILEHKRKEALIQLENVREQLHILALSNQIAQKELRKSFTLRIVTEKAAAIEIKRLEKIIYLIDESNRKSLMDEITTLREQLQIIATDKAISVLNDSYAKKDMSQKQLKEEISRLKDEIKNIKLEQKKKSMQDVKEVRDRIYKLALECESAKEELNNSFQRKLITIDDIEKEIDRLNIKYIECVEISRREKINKMNELRDEVYETSGDSQYARMKLENSFNKILDDKIIAKEIDTLEETIDRVYRDRQLKSCHNESKFFL